MHGQEDEPESLHSILLGGKQVENWEKKYWINDPLLMEYISTLKQITNLNFD